MALDGSSVQDTITATPLLVPLGNRGSSIFTAFALLLLAAHGDDDRPARRGGDDYNDDVLVYPWVELLDSHNSSRVYLTNTF